MKVTFKTGFCSIIIIVVLPFIVYSRESAYEKTIILTTSDSIPKLNQAAKVKETKNANFQQLSGNSNVQVQQNGNHNKTSVHINSPSIHKKTTTIIKKDSSTTVNVNAPVKNVAVGPGAKAGDIFVNSDVLLSPIGLEILLDSIEGFRKENSISKKIVRLSLGQGASVSLYNQTQTMLERNGYTVGDANIVGNGIFYGFYRRMTLDTCVLLYVGILKPNIEKFVYSVDNNQ